MDQVPDDIAWTNKAKALGTAIASRIIDCAFITFTFTTFHLTFRDDAHPYGKPEVKGKAKEHVRKETALALRFLFIIRLLLDASVPICMFFPYDSNTVRMYVDELPEYEPVRTKWKKRFVGYKGMGVSYDHHYANCV